MEKKDYNISDLAKDLGNAKLSKSAIDTLIKFEQSQFKIIDANSISSLQDLILSLKRRTSIFGYISIILFVVDILLSYLLVQNIVVWWVLKNILSTYRF